MSLMPRHPVRPWTTTAHAANETAVRPWCVEDASTSVDGTFSVLPHAFMLASSLCAHSWRWRSSSERPSLRASSGRPCERASSGRPCGWASSGRPCGWASSGRPCGLASSGRPCGRASSGRPCGRASSGRPCGRASSGRPSAAGGLLRGDLAGGLLSASLLAMGSLHTRLLLDGFNQSVQLTVQGDANRACFYDCCTFQGAGCPHEIWVDRTHRLESMDERLELCLVRLWQQGERAELLDCLLLLGRSCRPLEQPQGLIEDPDQNGVFIWHGCTIPAR